MPLQLFLLIFSLCSITTIHCATQKDTSSVHSFSESQIWSYLSLTQGNGNISGECIKSLSKVVPMLTATDTLDQQRQFYYKSFSSGDSAELIGLDMDRWFYRSIECQKVAGETIYSSSEYPLHFCFGSNRKEHSLAYGICIPSTCANDKHVLLSTFQSLASNNSDTSSLDYTECTQSRHEKQWYQKPIPLLHLSFDFFLSLMVVLGTIYDLKREGKAKSICEQVLVAFSYTRNCMKLAQMPKDPKQTIRCMFGLRFLMMFWTLIGHSFFYAQSFISNVDDLKKDLVDNFWKQWISNFTLGVDVFFMLSGTLLAYSWFKKWPTNDTKDGSVSNLIVVNGNGKVPNTKTESPTIIQAKFLTKHEIPGFCSLTYWLRFYRHRLIRLWPAYMYVLLGLTTRLSITLWHPMWPPTDPATQCAKNWPTNLLLVNSLFGNMCMPWTWYISCEFIFFVFSPLFLIGVHKNEGICKFLSIALIFLSSFLNIFTMHWYGFAPTPLALKASPLFNSDFMLHHQTMYIKPWFRLGPYVVGLLLGLKLAKLAQLEKQPVKSGSFMAMGWVVAIGLAFWAVFGIYPATQSYNWPIYHSIYGGFHRTAFSLAFGWLIYACQTGRATVLNSILGSRILLPLSSLSYSVYLVHLMAIAFTFMGESFPMRYEGVGRIFGHCVIQLVISYFIAGRVALVAELPVLNLERIFKQWKRQRNTLAATTENQP